MLAVISRSSLTRFRSACIHSRQSHKDVDLERRCGKPFTDSIEADRYALSLESLSSPTTGASASAVSVRQSVIRSFFEYLHPQVTSSQDSSRSEREYYDSDMTAGSELFDLAPEPHEIVHPSPVRPPRTPADFEPLQPRTKNQSELGWSSLSFM